MLYLIKYKRFQTESQAGTPHLEFPLALEPLTRLQSRTKCSDLKKSVSELQLNEKHKS